MNRLKNLTIAILLRVSLLIIICFYLFEVINFSTSKYSIGINPFIFIAFLVLLLLMSRQQHVYKKSRPNETIRYRDKILPEFNIKDEREAEITGYAAKNALSFILMFTPFAMVFVSYLFYYENPYSILLTFLTIAALPISGLVVYYITYHNDYLK
jgi:hypothetical protein